MGKYSGLKSSLTRLSEEDSYQDKVNAEKEKIFKEIQDAGDPLNPNSFGWKLIQAKIRKAELEAEVKACNLTIAAMDQALVERLEDESYTSLKLNNGVSLSIKDDVYASVSNKAEFHAWVRETKQEELFSVHYQTMASIVKSNLINGQPIPPGITPYFKQTISVRGIKDIEQD